MITERRLTWRRASGRWTAHPPETGWPDPHTGWSRQIRRSRDLTRGRRRRLLAAAYSGLLHFLAVSVLVCPRVLERSHRDRDLRETRCGCC